MSKNSIFGKKRLYSLETSLPPRRLIKTIRLADPILYEILGWIHGLLEKIVSKLARKAEWSDVLPRLYKKVFTKTMISRLYMKEIFN